MRTRTLAEVAAIVGGALRGPGGRPVDGALRVGGVSIDSRSVGPGELFAALPGQRVDGHEFVGAALRGGAAAAIVARGRLADPPGAVVEVDDPGRALLALAADERATLRAVVVGITGSTGKTCTKDFTAAALSGSRRVVASPASFNNEIGLPLTILGADDTTEVVVCEMGARGEGHIRALARVARPGVGVVTNVGVAHMGLFGSREAIARAKGELPEAVPPEGTVVLNADDPVVRGYAGRTAARVVLFGLGAQADVRAEDVAVDPRTGRATFRLATPTGTARLTLPVAGVHMVPNALAAAAVAFALDVDPASAVSGMAGASVSGGRMEVVETAWGGRLIDDAYNANPVSMEAGLRAARAMAGDGRLVAVLGEMAELGPIAAEAHEAIGALAAELAVDELLVVGEPAVGIATAAERAGQGAPRVTWCEDVTQAIAAALRIVRSGDVVIVKASLAAGLLRVADALRRSPERVAGGRG